MSQAPPNDRRNAILMSALECFNRDGIEATSIDEIGRRAGASVGSIYHHFRSKEGLAISLLAEGMSRNAQQLEERLRGARTARQGVKALVESLADWISNNPEWARYIYTVSSSRLMQVGKSQLQVVNAYNAKILADFFGPHSEAGAFRRLPRDCIPSVVLGPAHDYARRWLNGQVSASIASHADFFANAAWNLVRRRRHKS
jgi:AcrR family transcriptional regulator